MLISSDKIVGWTNWKFNLAVFPSNFFIRLGSSKPGNWTMILSVPCCWILGSLVPVSSILLLTISIACIIVVLVIFCLLASENSIWKISILFLTIKFLSMPNITDFIFSTDVPFRIWKETKSSFTFNFL